MPAKDVKYSAEAVQKAKAEGLHLVTLDITGKHAKRDGVTYQGYLLTPEQVDKAWEFFEWLSTGRHREKEQAK